MQPVKTPTFELSFLLPHSQVLTFIFLHLKERDIRSTVPVSAAHKIMLTCPQRKQSNTHTHTHIYRTSRMASSICLSSSYLSRDSLRGWIITLSIWGNSWERDKRPGFYRHRHRSYSHFTVPSIRRSPSLRSQTWGWGRTWWIRSGRWVWWPFLCPWRGLQADSLPSPCHSDERMEKREKVQCNPSFVMQNGTYMGSGSIGSLDNDD